MTPSLIHLEHALPPLAELGLEHLVPAFLGGGRVGLTQETISNLMQGLAFGAEKRAARRLVAISQATAQQLLEWEISPDLQTKAEAAAALCGFDEAKGAISDFFGSLGLSLNGIQDSSGTEEGEAQATPESNDSPA